MSFGMNAQLLRTMRLGHVCTILPQTRTDSVASRETAAALRPIMPRLPVPPRAHRVRSSHFRNTMPYIHSVPALVISLAACAPVAFAQAPSTDAALAAAVDAIVQRTLAQPNAVGLSIAVARGDQLIVTKGYGTADLESGWPVDDQTMMRIGSVTKQFSAAAVMKLVEQGKLSLDDTLDKMLPDYPPTSKPVTLRQILNHTSGIWSYTEDGKFMERDSTMELKSEEVIATFKDKPLEFDPGTKWNYSNSAYYLVGEIIERAAGMPYAQFVQEELFAPLGLSRTRYESNREIISNRAQGYAFDGGKLLNDQTIGADVPGAAGSLLSTAADLVRWNIALAGGKAVSPDSYALMTATTVLPSGRDAEYGLGLGIDTFEGRKRISHGGGIPGFTSMLAYLPEEKLTVAVISNCESLNPGKAADSIMRAALGIAEFVPKDLRVADADLARFAGVYVFQSMPLELTVSGQDGQVFAQATGQKATRLLYQGNGEFRADFDPEVKFVFPAGEGPAPSLTLHQRGQHVADRKP